jgi:drug/metabolite transporter (DMT)-like permease
METLRGVGIERVKATVWGAFFTAILGVLIVVGSRNVQRRLDLRSDDN